VSYDFADEIVLVTAGASGIGAATAEGFARGGARVVLADINAEGGEAVAARLRAAGAEALFVHADATSEDDVERLVQTTVDTFGGLTVAANVVGGVSSMVVGPELHTYSQEHWDGTVALCLRSAFLGMKHELAYMIEHGGGSIVNVASLTGVLYVPSASGAYGAAKAAVIHLTRFAALSYADRGVRVNSISPGVTATPIYEQADDGLMERLIDGHAIKRVIQPSEQADAILWLCSKQAAMVTGQDLRVDGGWSAR
jgi:NAD(P)-dependent dehydrogenase (short-subunit alcohol dehydrogenase family)